MATPWFNDQRLTRATRSRLARLGQRTVDVASLRRWFDQLLAIGATAPSRRPWLRPALAAAAVLALAILLALGLQFRGGAVNSVSGASLAGVHRGILSGELQVWPATDESQAHRELSRHLAEPPTLPRTEKGVITGCSVAEHRGQSLPVLLLRYQGYPVTVTVVQQHHLAPQEHAPVDWRDKTFHVHADGDVATAMRQVNDRWLCVTGKLPTETLIELNAAMRMD
jgi:hypothetical protein